MEGPVEGETPWALMNRMRDGGDSFPAIIAALRERGVEVEDIELLLEGHPGYESGLAERQLGGTEAHNARIRREEAAAVFDWRMLKRALLSVVFWGTLVAAVVSAVALVSFPTSSELWAIVGPSLVLALLSGAALMRQARAPRVLPRLAEKFSPGVITEFDDVHFVVSAPRVSPRGTVPVEFVFQNCVEVDRHITISFEATAGPQATGLYYPKEVKGRLGPGETASLTVHLWLGPDAPGLCELWLEPSAGGRGGRRVRPDKARTYARKIETGETVAVGLLTGIVRFGGGMSLQLSPAPGSTAPELMHLPDPEWRTLHQPTEDELIRALRS
jgi:hypothetical protein